MKKDKFILDELEFFAKTQEGLPLWKRKNVTLTSENIFENIFVLSTDLAKYFDIRHDNLYRQNIVKLKKERYLSDHILNFKEMVKIGSTAGFVEADGKYSKMMERLT